MVPDGEDRQGVQINDELEKSRLKFSRCANQGVTPLIGDN